MGKYLSNVIGRYDSGIWIRVLGSALTTTTGFMIRPFLVLYLFNRMEGSVIMPMLVVGLQPLFGMFVSWFGGSLSDKYGRKPLMLSALALQMLCMVGYVFAEDIWHYALISIVNGVGFALYMPAANAQMTDMVPEERRAEVFALMHTGFNVGAAVGPSLGLLMFNWNSTAVFLIAAFSFLLNGLLILFKLPETAPMTKGAPGATSSPKKPRISWKEHRTLLLMTLLSLPVGLLYAQVETTFPLHLQTNFEHFTAVLASLLTFNGIMVIALQIWIAKRTETMLPQIAIGGTYILFAAVAAGYGYSEVVWLLFLSEFVFTIGEMVFGPHMQKAVSLMAPPEQRGFYFSVYGASNLLSRGIGPVFGGLLLGAYGGETMFAVLAVVILLTGYMQYRVVRTMSV